MIFDQYNQYFFRFSTFLKISQKYFPIFLIVLIYILLVADFAYLHHISRDFLNREISDINDVQLAADFVRISFNVLVYELTAASAAATAAILWIIGYLFINTLLQVVIDIAYHHFVSENKSELGNLLRYEHKLSQILQPKLVITILIPTLLATILYCWSVNIVNANINEIADHFIIICSAILPASFFIHWLWYLQIRKNRKNRKYIDNRLFSPISIRSSFKTALLNLISLGLLGIAIIPLMLETTLEIRTYAANQLIEQHGYAEVWDDLMQSGVNLPMEGSRASATLPSPADLAKNLVKIPQLDSTSSPDELITTFQQKMFRIVSILTFCSIALPSLLRLYIQKNKNAVFKAVLVSTAKTTILFVALQILIQYIFLVDFSDPIGIGTFYMFIVSFFVAQDTFQTTKQ